MRLDIPPPVKTAYDSYPIAARGVLGDRRPHLPWYFDMSKAEALTAEWKASRMNKDEGAQ